MRLIIQRVNSAEVTIEGALFSSIDKGLLLFLGIAEDDTTEDAEWLAAKVCSMRIFSDDEGKMNLDIHQINGALLIVSQFTLFASTKKGNRPSFIKAANPAIAVPLYEFFIQKCTSLTGKNPSTGKFGADMQISLTNDGPVTIIIDSKNKE